LGLTRGAVGGTLSQTSRWERRHKPESRRGPFQQSRCSMWRAGTIDGPRSSSPSKRLGVGHDHAHKGAKGRRPSIKTRKAVNSKSVALKRKKRQARGEDVERVGVLPADEIKASHSWSLTTKSKSAALPGTTVLDPFKPDGGRTPRKSSISSIERPNEKRHRDRPNECSGGKNLAHTHQENVCMLK